MNVAPGEEGEAPEEIQEPRAGRPERQSARKKQPPSRYPLGEVVTAANAKGDKAKRR